MNLETMRSRFNDRCANLADDLSDAEIDVLLNEQYSYAIPDDLPGVITEGEWVYTTAASTQAVDFPDYVHSIRRGAIIDDTQIKMIFRASEMWARYEKSSTDESKPYAALFYEEKMTLFPVPDAAYTVSIPIREYPNDGTNVSILTEDGLSNDSHAKAVISGAAAERLADSGDFEHAQAETSRRATYMKRLRTRSVSPPKGRRAGRSW